MLIPALIIALVAAAVVIGVIAAEGDEGDGASDATRPSSVAPATDEDIAEPTVPAAAAPVTVPAAAVPAAAPETTTTQATSTTLTGAPAGSSTPPSTSSPTTTSPPPTAVAHDGFAAAGAVLPRSRRRSSQRPKPRRSFVRTTPPSPVGITSSRGRSWRRSSSAARRGRTTTTSGSGTRTTSRSSTFALVGADERSAVVNVELRWNGSSDTVIDQFTPARRAGRRTAHRPPRHHFRLNLSAAAVSSQAARCVQLTRAHSYRETLVCARLRARPRHVVLTNHDRFSPARPEAWRRAVQETELVALGIGENVEALVAASGRRRRGVRRGAGADRVRRPGRWCADRCDTAAWIPWAPLPPGATSLGSPPAGGLSLAQPSSPMSLR